MNGLMNHGLVFRYHPKFIHVRAARWSWLEVPPFVIELHKTSTTQLPKKYEEPIMIDNQSDGCYSSSIMKLHPIPNPTIGSMIITAIDVK